MKVISTAETEDGVLFTGEAVLEHGGVRYYEEGTKLTLSGSDRYFVRDKEGNNLTAQVLSGSTLTMPDKDIIISKADNFTVTFAVENGEWDGGGSSAVEKVLTGPAGTLKIAEGDIPAAGNKPAEDYKAGKWNPEPKAGDAVTGNVTYTYTYAKEDIVYTAAAGPEGGYTHTVGSGKDLVITVKRNINDAKTFDQYTGAAMDGKALPEGASAAEKGSLNLTVKSGYLDTLEAGDHTLEISFRDGAHGDRNAHTNPRGGQAHAHGHADSNTDSHADRDAHSGAHGNADTRTDRGAHRRTHGHADSRAHRNTQAGAADRGRQRAPDVAGNDPAGNDRNRSRGKEEEKQLIIEQKMDTGDCLICTQCPLYLFSRMRRRSSAAAYSCFSSVVSGTKGGMATGRSSSSMATKTA